MVLPITPVLSITVIMTTPTDGIINDGSADFVGLNGKTVDFIAEDDEETVDIQVLDESVYEGDETFTVEIVSVTEGEFDATPVTVTIRDDDRKYNDLVCITNRKYNGLVYH